MRRYLRAVGVGAMVLGVTVLVPGAGAGADDGGRPFQLDLSGANEFNGDGVPINAHGDSDRGTGTIWINPGQLEVCYQFGAITMTAGELLPRAAHIHVAPAGRAGDIVVDLFAPATAPTSYPTDKVCVAKDNRELLVNILRNPEEYYVNLHNTTHPAGVMRDQLRPSAAPVG